MTCEVTRQISVATTSEVLSEAERRPPQQAAEDRAVGDAVAGGVEHRTEPGAAAALACHRAVEHVGEHEEQTATAPHHSCPIGNNVSAPSTVPAVPRMVMLSGVKPARSAAFATGFDSFL